MMFGLSEENFETIVNCVKVFPDIDEAIIFGSRAMGNHKPASDIDIVVKGNLRERTITGLRSFLDNAPFAYKVDLLHYDTLNNAELKKHIDEHGKVIYKRPV